MSRKKQEKGGTGQKLRFPWDIVSKITARRKFLRTSAKFRSPIALDFAGRCEPSRYRSYICRGGWHSNATTCEIFDFASKYRYRSENSSYAAVYAAYV